MDKINPVRDNRIYVLSHAKATELYQDYFTYLLDLLRLMALLQRREPILIFKYGLSYNNRSPYILDKDKLISQLIERGGGTSFGCVESLICWMTPASWPRNPVLFAAFGYSLEEKKVEDGFGTTKKYFVISVRPCNTIFTISVPLKRNVHELSHFHWKCNYLPVCVFYI